ncbi:MAG: hypothetical protein ACOC44_13415, partial [Promethearchaeia archaeon]
MKNLKKIRNIIIISFLFIAAIQVIPHRHSPQNRTTSLNEEIHSKTEDRSPHNAYTDVNGSFSGVGDSQNVTLSQMRNKTYQDKSTSEEGITFNNPEYPKSGWNMTDFELNFTNLNTTGKYVPFEIRNDGSDTFNSAGVRYATSFTVPNSCYLKNISLFLQYWGGEDPFGTTTYDSKFSITIYNSTIQEGEIRPDAKINKTQDETEIDLTNKELDQPAKWYQANFSQRLLNISRTYNNTFFGVFESIDFPTWNLGSQDAYVYYAT